MASLITAPNVSDADALYAELIACHDGLSDEQSQALNAALVLLLANHVGDMDVLREAIAEARRTVCGAAPPPDGAD